MPVGGAVLVFSMVSPTKLALPASTSSRRAFVLTTSTRSFVWIVKLWGRCEPGISGTILGTAMVTRMERSICVTTALVVKRRQKYTSQTAGPTTVPIDKIYLKTTKMSSTLVVKYI